MTRNAKWLAVSGILSIAMFLLGCATRQYVPIVRFDPNSAGFTNCDQHGKPVIGIRGQIPIQEAYFIRIHEERHVEQVRSSGKDCQDFMDRIAADPVFRLQMEADAYCADLEARALAGYMRQPMVDSLVTYMQRNYANLLPIEKVRTFVPCAGDPPPIRTAVHPP